MKTKKKSSKPPTHKLGKMFLVIARATMDDVPMLLTPSIHVAKKFAAECKPSDMVRAAHAMDMDTSTWLHIAIMTFVSGKPIGIERVRQIYEKEADVVSR